MTNIIFLKPYLEAKVWGGNKLQQYGYQFDASIPMGEAWLISAFQDKSSIILNPELNGMSLKDFFDANRDFFNNYQEQYPLLTKIIEANADLSVQVHPGNEYALKKHNKLGKTECWYILDAEPGAEIVYGLKATSRQEVENALNNNNIESILNIKPVQKGDLVYIPSGLVHATKGKILFYELQQSSDLTYRLYDYNRLDNGQLRELHIEDSLNVINFNQDIQNVTNDDYLIDGEYFKLKDVTLNYESFNIDFEEAQWVECTVIDGFAMIDGVEVSKGSAFILKAGYKTVITGTCRLFFGFITKSC
ncbi:MAG: type I phosphomannose isomerase catalytic subunit [Mycoplasma sp.]